MFGNFPQACIHDDVESSSRSIFISAQKNQAWVLHLLAPEEMGVAGVNAKELHPDV